MFAVSMELYVFILEIVLRVVEVNGKKILILSTNRVKWLMLVAR